MSQKYNTMKIYSYRFGKNGTDLTLVDYEEEFKRLVNYTINDRNISTGAIGNYKIDNDTIEGR